MSFQKCPLCLSHNEILVEASEIWKQEGVDRTRLYALDKEYHRRFKTKITLRHIDLIRQFQKLP